MPTPDRFRDDYDPEPDYDRPSSNREAAADEAGMPERDDAWVFARYRQTCEDRDYRCCDLTPPGEDPDAGWYDRHVEIWIQTNPQTNKENKTVAQWNADPTEDTRRDMIETGQPAADLAATVAAEAPTWTTETLQQEFEVLGFMAPFVVVRRRSDRQKGTLEFTHSPRVYFNFIPS